MKKWLLPFILLLGLSVRLLNLNWDHGQHLHPDERFLAMVNAAQRLPANPSQYFQPSHSTLNPYNLDFNFFVYGHLPLNLNKLLASVFQTDNYDLLTFQGRVLTALADTTTIWIIFQIALLFEKRLSLKNKQLKYFSALIYAFSVLPIQLAHFFTTDPFLNLFVTAAIFFGLNYFYQPKLKWLLLASVSFSFALASKISAVYVLPLLIALILIKFNQKKLIHLFAFGLSVYITLRLVDPYYFQSASWLIPWPSTQLLANLKQLKSWSNPNAWFPPAIQWLNRQPILNSLKNLIVFGFGLAGSGLALVGLGSLLARSLSQKNKEIQPRLPLLLIFIWVLIYFFYQANQFSHTMRYFLPIYPWLALLSAAGSSWLIKRIPVRKQITSTIIIILLLIWPLMFLSVYFHDHPRVQASRWIYQQLPANSLILTEHWDDALPLSLPGNQATKYQIIELPVFAQDNEVKWQQINQKLAQADYYILSSNRAWGSISRAKDRYPIGSQFYQKLLSGEASRPKENGQETTNQKIITQGTAAKEAHGQEASTNQGSNPQAQQLQPSSILENQNYHYQLVKQFSSCPSLRYLGIGLTFCDQWAEEAFTVYDHPQVMIFKNTSK
ncbi:MAG: hypothetical protein GF381_02420 [Candidatus Pacebacteria bacterium]|nr:hypothetical protein [Candidatus Paceibacterota bacterium]